MHKVCLPLIGGLPGRGCIHQKTALPFPKEQSATDSQPDDAVIREKHCNIYPYYVPPFCIRFEAKESEAVQKQKGMQGEYEKYQIDNGDYPFPFARLESYA